MEENLPTHMEAAILPRRIVAIGASAGGLAALERLFRSIKDSSGDAFVVVQHLSPNFKSLMGELLSGFAGIPARLAEDRMWVEPKQIYVIPPGKDLEIKHGRLVVIRRAPSEHLHLPIDRFFASLALDARSRAVGVILSGTGSDGSRGIVEVSRYGGTVYVQSPESAAFDGMPRAAVRARVATLVDTPEKIAEALLAAPIFGAPPPALQPKHSAGLRRGLPADVGELAPIFEAMIDRFDLDFSDYKLGTVSRRVERRMKVRECETIEQYTQLVRHDEDELDALWTDLLIGVTCFFRDEEAFRIIEQEVLPTLLESKSGETEIRVWVPGCATGEEVYSLAILLDEAVRAQGQFKPFRLFATDVNRGVLDRASRGYFDGEALADVSSSRLERYFETTGSGYVVVPELRRRIVFAEHNLLIDPPFTRLDLVSCRNLLIYLLPDAQDRVLGKLEFSLRDHGYLMLGPSESLASENHGFEAIDRAWRIFRKLTDAHPQMEETSNPPRARALRGRGVGVRANAVHRPPRTDTDSTLVRVMERFVPSGFLVDGHRTVLHIFGDAGRYLNVSGPVSLDIVALVQPELQLVLTTAIHAALREHRSAHLTADSNGEALDIGVDCLHEPDDREPLLFVRIEPAHADRATDAQNIDVSDLTARRIRDLEEDLAETRLNLQAVVEELETSNEELQATNEELLASNEELQSTNEELQSVNEELHTVNAEYEKKNEDLLELTQDLTMLMDCTSIGMVFLGPQLEVRKFTPAIETVYPLRAQDIGRPLADMTDRLEDDRREVIHNAREVLRTGQTHEREVKTADGHPLLEQIHANRGRDGEARGVAITYVDLTSVKQAEAALRRSEARSQSVLNALAANVAVIDQHGTILAVNGRWSDFAELNSTDGNGRMGIGTNYLASCVQAAETPEEEDAHRALVGIQTVLSGRSISFEQVYPCHSPSEQRWFLMRVTPLEHPEAGAVIAHIDVTELERLRQASVQAAERLELLGAAITAASEGVMICDADSTIRYVNPSFEKMAGVTGANLVGIDLGQIDVLSHSSELHDRIAMQEPWNGEVELRGGNRRLLHLEATLSPILDLGGRAQQVVCVFRDVSEQRELEQSLRHAQKMEAIGTLAGGIAHDFNNLLGAIMGYADLLAEDIRDEHRAADDLRQIRQASHRARDLVDQILTFSRKTEGKRERVQPHVIVKECQKLLRGSIPSSVELDGTVVDSGWVDVDPIQLHQVVMNLATNAYHAIGSTSGSITIDLRPAGPEDEGRPAFAELRVIDDGVGMNNEVIQRAFEPFYTTKTDGTGMGLAVVHGIVSRLGGKIEIDSTVGEGTTMTVLLPTTEPPPPLEQPRALEGTGGSELVFVVDDEPAIVRLVERMLELDGYRVESFTSPSDLLDRFLEINQMPSLVLCDHAMPKMTGAALLRELRARGAAFPVVLMSGYTLGAGIRHELLESFAAIIKKPFRREDLTGCVRRVLDSAYAAAVS